MKILLMPFLFVAMISFGAIPASAQLVSFEFLNNHPFDGTNIANDPTAGMVGATDTQMSEDGTGSATMTLVEIFAPEYAETAEGSGVFEATGGTLLGSDPETGLRTITRSTNNGSVGNFSVDHPLGDIQIESAGLPGGEGSNFNVGEGVTIEFDVDVIITQIDFASICVREEDGAEESFDVNIEGVAETFNFGVEDPQDRFNNPFSDMVIPAGTDITFTARGVTDFVSMRIDEITVQLDTSSAPFSQATVETGGRGSRLYSSTADLVTGAQRVSGAFGDDAVSLAQSFQSSTAISLQSFAIYYEYDRGESAPEPNSLPVRIEIFEVADVQAETLVPGARLFDFEFPAESFPDNGDQGEALITLDTAIPLAAATGTEGYAIRISATGDGNIGFEWGRSVASVGGDVFPDGRGYDNDGEVAFNNSDTPERDLSLALNPVPGPLGDFDADGDVDVDDLDDYINQFTDLEEVTLAEGAPAEGALAALDLDGNGTVEEADFIQHYTTLVETSNGQVGTFVGDIDLDGDVDILGDAFILVGNLGRPATIVNDEGVEVDNEFSWSLGDLNADRMITVLGDAFLFVGNIGSTNE